MKLTALLIMAACLQVSANSSYSQNISLHLKNASLKQVFKEIQKQTNLNVIIEDAAVLNENNITINVQNIPVAKALEQCFANLPYTFTVVDNTTIVVKYQNKEESKSGTTNNQTAVNEVITITGRVVDDNGLPIAHAAVLNVTSKQGVNTDNDGKFSIKATPGDIIKVIFVGYKEYEYKVTKESGNKPLTIKIEPSLNNSKDIIVTGYQQIRKSEMTGASSKVKSEDLVINGTNTIEQILQGKLPGVEIVNNSGEVGTKQTVRVRGTSTLYGNQSPVWVVVGIIQEDPLPFNVSTLTLFGANPSNSDLLKNYVGNAIAWLSPYDIDEVTVLKDAAATAIYGVKAANGVIVITTKRGKAGRTPTINYNSSYSVQQKLSYDRLNLMNSKQRVDVSREIWERGLVSITANMDDIGFSGLLKQYLNKTISYDAFNSGVKQLETNNTNWFDLLYQTPFSQSQNISFSGGGTSGTYYASFGYNSQLGQAKGNGQTAYRASLNMTANPTPKLSLASSLSVSNSATTGFYNVNPYTYATQTSRVIPAYNTDGSLAYYKNSSYNYNILNELANSGNQNNLTSLNGTFNAKYRLPAGFQIESILGVNFSYTHAQAYASEYTNQIAQIRLYEVGVYGPNDPQYKQSRLPRGGILTQQDIRNTNYTWRNSLSYARVFNKKHIVSGMGGMELRSNSYNGNLSTAYGYLPDVGQSFTTPPPTVFDAAGNTIANTLYSINSVPASLTQRLSNYVSYFLTGSYTYDERYTFTVSVRGDASNQFGQDVRSRFKPIWALGGRWNLAKEHFLDNRAKWMNDISLRASYGYQANVAENYGPDLILKYPTGAAINTYTGANVLLLSQLPYGNLRPEKTQTFNLGLDFSLLNARITGSVDYYVKNSKDLITFKDIPYENGVTSMPINVGTLYNRGIDLALNFVPVRNKNFTWALGIVTSRNINKITSNQYANFTWLTATSGNYYVNGYATGSFWVFDFAGLDSTSGMPKYNIPTVAQNPSAKTDATAYMKYAGRMTPDFTGNFNTTFSYKRLTVSTNFYMSFGGKKLLAPLYTSEVSNNTPNEYNNYSADLVNRWRKPGDEKTTNIPSLPQYGPSTNFITLPAGGTAINGVLQASSASVYALYNFSSLRVVDATYFRINNINVSYNIPDSWAKKLFSKRLFVTYTVSNPFTFVNKDYKGRDLEVASGSQPLSVSHVISISATF